MNKVDDRRDHCFLKHDVPLVYLHDKMAGHRRSKIKQSISIVMLEQGDGSSLAIL